MSVVNLAAARFDFGATARDYFHLNVKCHESFLKSLIDIKVKKFVHVSSVASFDGRYIDYSEKLNCDEALFEKDLSSYNDELVSLVSKAHFLVIGGAGSIGQAVVGEIFKRDPAILHVVDISENNMVELVRDLRSTVGYGSGDFKTFALDCGSIEFEALMKHEGPYNYVFNLSALEHVRSGKDPYTLMCMIMVNVFNTVETLRLSKDMGSKKYFCVSTDKAANPVNMMGASKRIMEMFLMRESLTQEISMARFGNVAFSDGSLLLVVVSGSGNSPNIVKAVNEANKIGADTLAILGYDGGAVLKAANKTFLVPSFDMQVCEDIHLMFGHMVMKTLCGSSIRGVF